ncbi:MAG: tetratricopeptide repeat protein [Treponema sp.]
MKNCLRSYSYFKKIVIILAVTACSFFSCSTKIKSTSIIGILDEADRYISQGQTDSALKLLSKTDRPGLSPDIRLGIYKRYLKLGENSLAEKLLKSCFKKNPDDKRVIAVYSSRLLKQNKIKEALSVSKKLSGSEYSSIYAQAVLRNRISVMNADVSFDDFCTEDYMSVYFDAFNGSKDNCWLRNCAVINLVQGNLAQALACTPAVFSDSLDAYFWAMVYYDNNRFVESSETLTQAKNLIAQEMNDFYINKASSKQKENLALKIRSLLADSYINLSEENLAETERNSLLAYISTLDEEEPSVSELPGEYLVPPVDILSVIYLNSALWSLSKEDYNAAYQLLKFEVEKWPDYAPGLIAYGNFAYNSSQFDLSDPMTVELRKLGIQSLDMKKFDSLPRVPVEDALFKMNSSLSRFKNFELYVAKLDLEDKIQQKSEKARLARIYQELERNSLGTNLYPPEIARYAVHGFLMLDSIEEAESFFNKYIASQYSFDSDEDFFDEFFRNIHQMRAWEIEYAAWFSANSCKANLAQRLYEFLVLNEYLLQNQQVQKISHRATFSSMLNLAMIYSSTKNKDEALNLYGVASNSAKTPAQKAEALYRAGVLYSEKGSVDSAVKSLKYAVYLDPSHTKARLLLAQLKK